MSAPVDAASEGGATGLHSVPGASPEVELQGGLCPNGGTTSPAQWLEAHEEEIGEEAAAAPSAASSVSSRATKRPTNPVTTARSSKKAKKSAADKIGKGHRVFCKKKLLIRIVPVDSPQCTALKGRAPGTCLYGTVITPSIF